MYLSDMFNIIRQRLLKSTKSQCRSLTFHPRSPYSVIFYPGCGGGGGGGAFIITFIIIILFSLNSTFVAIDQYQTMFAINPYHTSGSGWIRCNATSANPDEMPHFAAFHLSLHCLQR